MSKAKKDDMAFDTFDKVDVRHRLLRIHKILKEYSDEEHVLNKPQIVSYLEKDYEVTADIKAVQDDIDALLDEGVDIIKIANEGIYLGDQVFEQTELKILVDAIQSSKFIPKSISEELIDKLGTLCSSYNRKDLTRDVYMADRVKSINKSILYYTDYIHQALRDRKKISFKYCEWNTERELVPRHDGEIYVATPVAVVMDDGNYYLIAREDGMDYNKTFRVDKLLDVKILDEPGLTVDNKEYSKGIFSKCAFGMFNGDKEKVTLVGKKELVGVVIDRFGNDFLIIDVDDDHFTCDVNVVVSNQFFGWLTGIGDGLWIKNPKSTIVSYEKHLETMLEKYRKL